MSMIVMLIVGILAVAFFITGIIVRSDDKNKMTACDVHATATVVGNVKGEIGPRDVDDVARLSTYYPIIEYVAEGRTIKRKLSVGNPKEIPVGTTVEIMYAGENPEKVILSGNTVQKTVYQVFLGVGVVLVLVEIILVAVVKVIS